MSGATVKLRVAVLDKAGTLICDASGTGGASLTPTRPWQEGDSITIWTSAWPVRLRLAFDSRLPAAEVWLTADRMDYPVPYREELQAYPPGAFAGAQPDTVRVQVAEIPQERCALSENPLDRRGETTYYPHCTASVETRGESVFAARNTIDGRRENTFHGEWPYTSWGEDENPFAEIMVEFGRPVRIDGLCVWLRADFPHDNWWKTARLVFSDGSAERLTFSKTKEGQEFPLAPRTVTWAKLTNLEKDEDDPSPFPALTQWTFYGYER